MKVREENILLIGGTGRNSGKTEYVCGVIRSVASQNPVVAIKVTTFAEGDEKYHGTRDGHTAARHLPHGFQLTEEKDRVSDKDTSRMLDAGARRVYWLRARKERLAEGIKAALAMVLPGEAVVCESNSLRNVLKPALFVVVSDDSPAVKPSCLEVIDRADIVAVSNGASFTPPPGRIRFINGGWTADLAKKT